MITNTDIIGYGYMTDYLKDTSIQSNRVDYENTLTGAITYKYYSITGVDIGAAQSKFPININRLDQYDIDYDWASSGYGKFGIYKTGQFNDAAVVIKYGHSTFTLSPSVSYPWGLGIGFSRGVEELGAQVVESSIN